MKNGFPFSSERKYPGRFLSFCNRMRILREISIDSTPNLETNRSKLTYYIRCQKIILLSNDSNHNKIKNEIMKLTSKSGSNN